MTDVELNKLADAVAKSVLKTLQKEMLINDTRHLTPREYAAKARI